MPSWSQKELKLKRVNQWKSRPGCKIFVADAGAVRFDIPKSWVVLPDDENVKIYDKQPPNDDCALIMSYFRLPPIDWSELTLVKQLTEATDHADSSEHEYTKKGDIVEAHRADLEIAWREMHFIDEKEQRPAISRILVGRRKLIQCLITFDFWLTDFDRCNPVWQTVIETLTLSQFIHDPTTGR
jgi:hypothetical protein